MACEADSGAREEAKWCIVADLANSEASDEAIWIVTGEVDGGADDSAQRRSVIGEAYSGAGLASWPMVPRVHRGR